MKVASVAWVLPMHVCRRNSSFGSSSWRGCSGTSRQQQQQQQQLAPATAPTIAATDVDVCAAANAWQNKAAGS
eukprot:scaffold258689_cov15-Tisochrysis_lutea.AAC.1